MIAFFNRNLRLAHLYGGYGPSKYDMVSKPLPLVDLTSKQTESMPTIPLHFYRGDVARSPAGRKQPISTSTSNFSGIDIVRERKDADDMERSLLG